MAQQPRENSHQPTRRRERKMQGFKSAGSAQRPKNSIGVVPARRLRVRRLGVSSGPTGPATGDCRVRGKRGFRPNRLIWLRTSPRPVARSKSCARSWSAVRACSWPAGGAPVIPTQSSNGYSLAFPSLVTCGRKNSESCGYDCSKAASALSIRTRPRLHRARGSRSFDCGPSTVLRARSNRSAL
jgi:hypothetical protein